MSALLVFVILLAVLNALDAHSTYLAIKQGGREANPILLWLEAALPRTGVTAPWAWLVVKLVVVWSALAVVSQVPENDMGTAALALVVLLYAGVVSRNYSLLK